jgi:uncharacterized protein (DUF1501 family)
MLNRRSFLQSSSLLALASTIPQFLSRTANAMAVDKDGRVLVVVQLDGGNDALNTIVPHSDPNYAKLRTNLRLDPKNLLKLTDAVGLHRSLKPLDKLLDAGQLAVIPGVGYPNPNRSHFESMAIWHTARFEAEDHKGYGWLGRAFDHSASNLYSIGGEVPTALRGRRSTAASFNQIEDVLLNDAALARPNESGGDTDLQAFVRRQAINATATAEKLSKLTADASGSAYPQTPLGEKLKLVSRLLRADLGGRVFYTQQGSYDTHSQQLFTHANLLNEFASAVAAFFADLKTSKLADRVTLLAFSEFGRTIHENGSAGTDHGTAGAVFVAGPTVKGGLVGTMPNLGDLDKGEPKMTTDFRAIYAALLENWLTLKSDELGKGVRPMALFHKA